MEIDITTLKVIVVIINLIFLAVGYLWGRSVSTMDVRQIRANTKELLSKLRIEEPFILKEENVCKKILSNTEFKCRKAMDALYRSPQGYVPKEAQKYYRKERDTFL